MGYRSSWRSWQSLNFLNVNGRKMCSYWTKREKSGPHRKVGFRARCRSEGSVHKGFPLTPRICLYNNSCNKRTSLLKKKQKNFLQLLALDWACDEMTSLSGRLVRDADQERSTRSFNFWLYVDISKCGWFYLKRAVILEKYFCVIIHNLFKK